MKEKEMKELVDKMFESATVLETNMSSNDVNRSKDLLVGGLVKLLNDGMKIDDIYSILNKEKKEKLSEVMTDLFHIGIILGVFLRDTETLLPTLKRMLEENTELQQKLEDFQKRGSKFELNMFG